MGKQPRPRKELPAWTKKTPDVVSVNPGPSKSPQFKHTAPKPQHNFTKKSSTTTTTNMPVGSAATVLNSKEKKKR